MTAGKVRAIHELPKMNILVSFYVSVTILQYGTQSALVIFTDVPNVIDYCPERLMWLCMQPIECKAAIAWEAEKPLDVTTVIVDPPQKGEVRVKVS